MTAPGTAAGQPPVLSDGVVLLRPLALADVDLITRACQDPDIVRGTTVPAPYEREHAIRWVQERTADWWTCPTWAIAGLDGRWAGSIDLRPDGAGAADVGYLIAPWMRHQQLATRALRLACSWGFGVLGLEVICWAAYAGNDASRATAARVGFRIHRDIARKALVQRGTRVDAMRGDLLPADLAEATRPGLPALTPRERQVLDLLAQGRSNRQIATALLISENTVKNHVRAILDKLNAESRMDAVVRGINAGLTRLP